MDFTRRQLLKMGFYAGAGLMIPWKFRMNKAYAVTQGPGLSNPAMQPLFTEIVPNALDPGFIYRLKKGAIDVAVAPSVQFTGLVGPDGITQVRI